MDYYIRTTEAREALLRRRALRQQVEAWWHEQGWGLPPLLCDARTPLSVFPRAIATARYEDAQFLVLSLRAGLLPCWLEYAGDRFSSASGSKRAMVMPYFNSGRGKRGGFKLERRPLVAGIDACEHRLMGDLRTHDGQTVVDFHHENQDRVLGPQLRADCSSWLTAVAGRNVGTRGSGISACYYEGYLSLFLAHAVLFEDFHGGESGDRLDAFTRTNFEPAFAALAERFDAPPLIVPMPWKEGFNYFPAGADWAEHNIVDLGQNGHSPTLS